MAGNDSNTRLLLHFDDVGASIGDYARGGSAKAFSGGGLQSKAQRKWDYGALACGPATENCRIGANDDWNLGTDDWTLDAWVYVANTSAPYVFGWYLGVDNFLAVERIETAGADVKLGFTYRASGVNLAQASAASASTMFNTWKHVALSRSGQTLRLFLGGVLIASGTLPNTAWPLDFTLFPLYVGSGVDRGDRTLKHLSGFIDEVRLQVGFARTSNFTPPADAYQPTIEVVCGGSIHQVTESIAVCGGMHEQGALSIIVACGGAVHQVLAVNVVCGGAVHHVASQQVVCGGAVDEGRTSMVVGLGGACTQQAAMIVVCGGAVSQCGTAIIVVCGGEVGQYITAAVVCGGAVHHVLGARVVCGGALQQQQGGDRYLLFHGLNSIPDLTGTPDATSDTLPFSYPISAAGLHYFVVRERNMFGLVSQNITPTIIELNASSNEIMRAPSEPEWFSVIAVGGAKVEVRAQYRYLDDAERAASTWLIFTRNNGTDPDPTIDTPTLVPMKKMNGLAALLWTSGSFGAGQTIKVLVRTRRTTPARDSGNITPVATTAVSAGPAAPSAKALHSVSGVETLVG